VKRARNQARNFVGRVAELSFDCAFNPYSDRCVDHDGADAPAIRRSNLALVLEAAMTQRVDSFWIARDLGYRGGRRTGLALTDEIHLAAHGRLFGTLPLARATTGPAVSERTATIIWQVLKRIDRRIFLWNVFPLHPYESGDPMSNRCHTRSERQACRPLLIWLLDALQPKTIVAIGRDAEVALADLRIQAAKVRHPSYGGQAEFVAGTAALYGLPEPQAESQVELI
jgi:hypothetical protein